MPSLSPTATRELVHLFILRELGRLRRGATATVKGGVNLRLFFDSIRYSEDMDLDGTPEASAEIRSCLKGLFDHRELTRSLQKFGIRGLDPGQGPNKDTDTTFRYKFGVIAGGVKYPTKVEVSFRNRQARDRSVLETPRSGLLNAYGLPTFQVRHYDQKAAVRQKLEALAGRREAQARDVFDINVLIPDGPTDALIAFLAETVRRGSLEEAHTRALAINYSEYVGQVFEFLSEEVRSRYATESMWDEVRLRVAALIESVLRRQEKE